ncbi:hypothetical protein PCC7418_3767 [Halothece sp. PCC 7418]|uniref:hypothetical protein n=1 Tax=Halothece sp. (strain PCC 7418) TaxID=65093 RepID=UPI0002A06E95|nr:hypothetical protein [Halothece sp. PCC 7418]AFZ45871.1 hypothetical protein PCC7418_3767 [Halothece sp. PCC 7418]
MKRYPQLTRLIWNYYRENKAESQQLKILGNCKVNRRWGTFRIQCPNLKVASSVCDLIPLLELPIIKLRLAKRIKIFVEGSLFRSVTVGSQDLRPADARKFLTNY